VRIVGCKKSKYNRTRSNLSLSDGGFNGSSILQTYIPISASEMSIDLGTRVHVGGCISTDRTFKVSDVVVGSFLKYIVNQASNKILQIFLYTQEDIEEAEEEEKNYIARRSSM
jgi:hypothetical protein